MAEAKVVGALQLEIVEDGFKATATYFPDPEGIAWDEQKLRSLLSEEGVISGFDPGKMDEIIAQFAGSEEKTVVVAEGAPVELPISEEVMWEDLPIPEDKEEDASVAFLNADPPRIYLTRSETVKTEKIIETKPKLPFLKPKQTKKTVSEKREHREQIAVEPEVVAKGWAEEGALIASVARAESGIPGKSVKGTPIPPPPIPEPSVYAGEGTDYTRGEIRAAVGGFVRRGANWVDIVGFRTHQFEVETSTDRGTYYLSFTPGNEGAKTPEAEAVIATAVQQGAKRDNLISLDEISAAIEQAIADRAPVDKLVLSTDRDGSMSIDESDDGMTGTITLHKGTGKGKKLDLKEVGSAITSTGFVGMDIPKIRQDILSFHRGPDLDLEAYPLAVGTPAENGESSSFEFAIEFMSDEKAAEYATNDIDSGPRAGVEIDSIKEFSLDDISRRAFVATDLKVAVVAPSTRGKSGKDIHGNAVEAKAPDEVSIKTLEGLELVGENLIAQVDGILETGEVDETTFIRVRSCEDAKVIINVTPDRLQVEATIEASIGSGKPVTVGMVEDALTAAGVSKGIDDAALRGAVDRSVEKGSVSGVIIAKGKDPIPGSEPEVNFKVSIASGRRVTVEEDDHADYRHQDRITYVKEGQLIATISPSVEPIDGWDISGDPVSASTTQTQHVEITESLEKRETDAGLSEVYSKANGALTFRDGVIDVTRVLEINKDVDMDVGNLRFGGMIHVSGNVLSGFHLFSEEGIFIDGSIDASLLSAGKDITIGEGIRGAGKGAVRAKGNIEANFAERATLLAVGDIIINRACLGCDVKCNGKLVLEGDNGRLVGGVVRAKHGLDVESIGTSGGARATVSFGQDYLVGDRITLEEKKISELTELEKRLELGYASLERQGKTEQLSAFRKKREAVQKEIVARKRRVFGLREIFERDYDAEVRIRGTVYPGLRLESHGRVKEINSEHRDITFVFDKVTGRIVDKDGTT